MTFVTPQLYIDVVAVSTKKAPKNLFWSFCYEVCLTLAALLRLQCYKRNRLHLVCFACRPRYSYYQRLALIQNRVSVIAYRAVHSVTLCPVENHGHPHQQDSVLTIPVLDLQCQSTDRLSYLWSLSKSK